MDPVNKILGKEEEVKCWNCGDEVKINRAGNYFCKSCHVMIKHNPDSLWGQEAHKLDKYGNYIKR